MQIKINNIIASMSNHLGPQEKLVVAVLIYRGPTTTDIFEHLGIKSPSAVIYRLRKLGISITTKIIVKKTTKYSWLMHQAEYELDTIWI